MAPILSSNTITNPHLPFQQCCYLAEKELSTAKKFNPISNKFESPVTFNHNNTQSTSYALVKNQISTC